MTISGTSTGVSHGESSQHREKNNTMGTGMSRQSSGYYCTLAHIADKVMMREWGSSFTGRDQRIRYMKRHYQTVRVKREEVLRHLDYKYTQHR